MNVDTTTGPVWEVLASVLGLPPEEIAERAAEESFLGLGGDSVSAMDFSATMEEEFGQIIDVGRLIGLAPLANVLADALPGAADPAPAGDGPLLEPSRPVVPEQDGYLNAARLTGGTAQHQIVGGELHGPLDEQALTAAVERLTDRHEALRTVFEETPEGYRRRVLPTWRPGLVRQELRPAPGADPVRTVQSALVKDAAHLVSALGRPAHAFVLTRFGATHHLLTLICHSAVADLRSAGVLWEELAACYAAERAGTAAGLPPAPTPDVLQERHDRDAGRLEELGRRRIAELGDCPTVVELPSDVPRPARFDFQGARIPFGLTPRAREAAERLAARACITPHSVLLAAWQVVIARRAALNRFLVGVHIARRAGAATRRLVGPCAALVPVRCDLEDTRTVEDHLRGTSAAVAEGVSAASVPFGALSRGLRAHADGRRMPLIQVAFSGQDGALPGELDAGGLRVRVRQVFNGHTGADVTLLVLRWGTEPELAVEYATGVMTAREAAALAEAVEATLLELDAHYGEPLGRVRGMSPRQRQRLTELGGCDAPAEPVPPAGLPGIWHHLERRALEQWDQPAVNDPARDLTLTYGELVQAAAGQAGVLAAGGVGEGDTVAVALPRSADEVITVLAALRLGAAYLPLDPQSPPGRLGRILGAARPVALVGTGESLRTVRPLLPPGCVPLLPRGAAPRIPALVPPVPDDSDRLACVLPAPGDHVAPGRPEGVLIRQRALLRLALDGGIAGHRAGDRVPRLAPLGSGLSVLELFGPLLNGGTVDVFPDGPPRPRALAAFFQTYGTSVAVLPSAVFRTLVEHRPDAFTAVRRVLVGDGEPAPEPVRALLRRHPGLTVSHVHLPTAGGTAVARHDLSDACEAGGPLPLGRPVAGTRLLVLDERGGAVPPGGAGELCVLGDGAVAGYLGGGTVRAEDRDENRAEDRDENGDEHHARHAFGTFEGERYHRTGDLARWDGEGRLRFLGRLDAQVTVGGYRVDPQEVRARIAAHPAVADVVVAAVGPGPRARRLLAAVVLRRPLADPLDELRRFAGEGLRRPMMPELWAVVEEIPLTPYGRPDLARLQTLAVPANPHL
ncbi:AMP-binding protein [Streptomyces sp. MST-110588]|uniref:AMP-binding protein n=1 Tax=Streptomyces sp. MST-110588 TaxID=2833628 RepID=UPI001F5C40B9|nr:AMP-binding protein [Streptomyces sp. MST-110588]UNO40784.1 AMP-binding protein [Streptomyces sp. MST-110588]